MTDHESEQFYQDLRRKLDGYGSAPPESVWTAIREQVPARQPKRRRPVLLWLALLLGALLTGLALGPGRWPALLTPADHAGSTAGVGPATTAHTPAAGRPNVTPNVAGSAAADLAALRPGAASGSATDVDQASGPDFAAGSSASPASSTARIRGRQAWLAALNSRSGRTSPGSASDRAAGKLRFRRTLQGRANQDEAAGALAGTAGLRSRPSHSRRSPGRVAAAEAGLMATRRAGHPSYRSLSSARHSSADGATAFHSAARRRLAATVNPDGAFSTSRRSRREKLSNERLDLLAVHLPAADHDLPDVTSKYRRPRARRPTKRELRLRDWSVQILAGTGLTYRALGSGSSQLEQLERPALAYSGQITAGYAFSRQLTLTAGLGYAEYATTLRYQLQKPTLEALQPKDFRNTYRLLTVPVQAQLTLGTSTRWRYGLLGGGTAAFLVGARTTEGSACNCQQTQWTMDAPRLPFNRTNLLLTGGAFASYQFGLGQWLTVQPLGQLFLNSITTPESGLTARRPWALGVQAGYRWDLDPRKH